MRTLLLLLIMVSLLTGSATAVAHVDDLASTSSHATQSDGGGGASTGHDQPSVQKHCDLCAHGFAHLATVAPVGPVEYVQGVIQAVGPPLPSPSAWPDRQDRPPK